MRNLNNIEINSVAGGEGEIDLETKAVHVQFTPEQFLPKPKIEAVTTQFTPEQRLPKPSFRVVTTQFTPEEHLPKPKK